MTSPTTFGKRWPTDSALAPGARAVWVEVQIETGFAAAELLAAAASEVADGVELRDADTLIPAAPGRVVVVALCAPDEVPSLLAAVDHACGAARRAGLDFDPVSVRRREADEAEWRDVWKQFFRATRIGRSFVVRPSWDPGPVIDQERVIDLDPGRAFGTGGHPSTRLVMELAEDVASDGAEVRRFLDLGCGSGILALAAARLWPSACGTAVDLDAEAVECARENLARNRVTRVDVTQGALDAASGPFDLVLANIQADVLGPLAHPLAVLLAPGAAVLLSGVLAPDAPALAACYVDAGFVLRDRRDEDGWTALRLAWRG